MINFFRKPKDKTKSEKVYNLKDLSPHELMYKVLPRLMMEILRKYLRVEVEGLENVPRRGAALICPNHSGFSGFDALVLAHVLHQDFKRIPRVLTHQFWFLNKATAIPAQKMGFTEATFDNGVAALTKNNLVVIFPEGELGNFKSSDQMYQLQEFKRGFVRMAVTTQSPIVPCLVIGAEETHINLRQLKLSKYLRGLVIPLPLNFIPLPVKWKIKFLPPIYLPYKKDSVDDRELMAEVASEIQEQMQEALSDEVIKRKSVFFG
jgi:1-acyl-sn-glycerol-3-phosphate acyltransferase